MKKLLFIISCAFIISAYIKPAHAEETLPVSITEFYCKMGKYNCWDIIKDIKNKTQFSTSEGKGAYNPALEKKGLSIKRAHIFPKGNKSYDLSNNTHIFMNYDEFYRKQGTWGHTIITDNLTAKQVTYDTEGNIVSYSPGHESSKPATKPTPKPLKVSLTESSCKINNYDCWTIIKDLKNETMLSPSKGKAYNPVLEKKEILITNFHQDKYVGSSQTYNLANQIAVFINYDKNSDDRGTKGYTTLTDIASKKTLIYDTKGKILNTKNSLSKFSCKLGIYNCWDIIQDINLYSGKNLYSALRKKGISVIEEDSFSDGGSLTYLLSNGINIFINHEMFCEERTGTCGYSTLTDLFNKKQVTYDTKGNIVSFKELK